MIVETEGIVIKQTKTVNGKKMLSIFTPKYGKISVGTNITPSTKNKSSLSTRPFSYSKYTLYKNKDIYTLSSSEIINSNYSIGEDYDKYIVASYALELTDKVIVYEEPNPKLFSTLKEFLESLAIRKKSHNTLLMSYMVKTLDILGVMPKLDSCSCCNKKENINRFFSIEQGGIICDLCAKLSINSNSNQLIYDTNFGIVDTLIFFKKEPFSKFEKIALNSEAEKELKSILLGYMKYHLDISDFKTENLIFDEK